MSTLTVAKRTDMTIGHCRICQTTLGALALPRDRDRPDARLALHLLVASLPLVIIGYLLKDLVTEALRDPTVIAWATLGFGLLLYAGDRWGAVCRRCRW